VTNFQFELVSPSKLVFSEQVSMIVLPGEEGYFGVLKQHMPMVAQLRTGLLEVYKVDNNLGESFFIEDGIAEINNDSCTVLAEKIYNKDNMTIEDLLKRENELESMFNSSGDISDKKNISSELEKIQEFVRLLKAS